MSAITRLECRSNRWSASTGLTGSTAIRSELAPLLDVLPIGFKGQAYKILYHPRCAHTPAAEVADYKHLNVSDNKIKKKDGDMSIALKRTKDIIGTLGEHKKEGQVIWGFSMETENVIANSKDKLIKKNMDMIVANNVKVAGAGFGTDTNVVTIITGEDNIELPMMSKEDVASKILDFIMAKRR